MSYLNSGYRCRPITPYPIHHASQFLWCPSIEMRRSLAAKIFWTILTRSLTLHDVVRYFLALEASGMSHFNDVRPLLTGDSKSQIAIQYCYKYKSEQPDSHVLWIHCGTV